MEFLRKSKGEEEEIPSTCDFFRTNYNNSQWVVENEDDDGGIEPQNQQQRPAVVDLSLRMETRSSEGLCCIDQREHMFDKVVTPSDVGKLNRLVIPKQHAEKYFPLDSTAHEKGLILNFEDPNGKPWRFRYSYWNSSQSYVMTKGWSRFVKDKKLDAGDLVSFHRGPLHRLFIDCRRRPPPHHPPRPLLLRWASPAPHFSTLPPPPNLYPNFGMGTSNSSMYYFRPSSSSSLYNNNNNNNNNNRMANCGDHEEFVFNKEGSSIGINKPGSGGAAAAAKRLRLFGVNIMECSSAEADAEEGRSGDLSNGGVSRTGKDKEPFSLNWDLL